MNGFATDDAIPPAQPDAPADADRPLFAWKERARLRLHFARVLAAMHRAGAPAGTDADARRRMLGRLRDYAREGRFPRHGGTGAARPVFIDQRRTHCAVGHLLACGGAAALVAHVAATRNHAYVAELVRVPGVPSALKRLAITPREAARVQPSYPATSPCWVAFALQLAALALTIGPVLLFLRILPGYEHANAYSRLRGSARRPWVLVAMLAAGLLLGALVIRSDCGPIWSMDAWTRAAQYRTPDWTW